MNCEDISRLVDDGSFELLADELQQAVKLHLACCPDCARDWQLHTQLAAEVIPPMPPQLRDSCRVLVVAGPDAGRVRMRSRFILAGSLLAVAAAAALLGWQLRDPPRVMVAAPMSAPPAPVTPESVDALSTAQVVEPAATAEVTAPVAVAEPESSKSFTVAVLPLIQESGSPASMAEVEMFYASLLAYLRVIPDLVLVDPQVPAQFRITVKGLDPAQASEPTPLQAALAKSLAARAAKPANLRQNSVPGSSAPWRTQVTVDIMQSSGLGSMGSGGGVDPLSDTAFSFEKKPDANGAKYTSDTGAYLSGQCTRSLPQGASTTCPAPESVAAAQVDQLRKRVFPVEYVLREMMAGLQDPALSEQARTSALFELQMLARQGQDTWDPATIQGIVDLANATKDPQLRVLVWNMLKGVRNPALIPVLLAAMRDGPDDETSLTALGLLQSEFAASNPAVRVAIEEVARKDSRELVKQVASRIVNGESGWQAYVVATLRDASQTYDVRLAPLSHMARSSELAATLPAVMNDEAMTALAGMLPQIWSSPSDSQVFVQVLGALARRGHPGSIAVAAQAFRTGPEARLMPLVLSMADKYRHDPAVREALDAGGVRFPRMRAMLESLPAP